jgi:hypothetical protein
MEETCSRTSDPTNCKSPVQADSIMTFYCSSIQNHVKTVNLKGKVASVTFLVPWGLYITACVEPRYRKWHSDWLRDRVRVEVGSRIFTSPCRRDRLCSPPSLLSNGYRRFLRRGNTASAWSLLLNFNWCRCQGNVDIYIHSCIRLLGVVLNYESKGTTLSLSRAFVAHLSEPLITCVPKCKQTNRNKRFAKLGYKHSWKRS